MQLLEFARGPGLQIAITVLVLGTAWRLASMLVLRWDRRRTEARASAGRAGLASIFRRFWPMDGFQEGVRYGHLLGYVSHLGLAVVVFGGVFHIELIESITGLHWPSLPPAVISTAAALSIGAFLALLIRRFTQPVLRMLSTWDDYFSSIVVILPLVTGLAAAGGVGLRYETLLALHILSAELLLIWIPFGKLFHAFSFIPSRAFTGAQYGRRGVPA